ncbi:MAG: zinc ribbon domain-containing protein [Pseudomonadota bacterium]
MPIYEYECAKCGKIEEVIQKFSDKPLSKCKSCSGKLHKLMSHSTFQLKGSGWYVTDYAGKSQGSAPPPPKTENISDSKKSDSNPKTKTE